MKFSIITPSHNPKYLDEVAKSVLNQLVRVDIDFEWIVALNNGAKWKPSTEVLADERVCIVNLPGNYKCIGHVKNEAFNLGTGDILVELDHDDLLTPDCLIELSKAFTDPRVQFAYSNFCEFEYETWKPTKFNPQYGWSYEPYIHEGHVLEAANAWPVSPASVGLIYFAPNHVRAWRRTAYKALGGHNASYKVADDHELVIRTYLIYGEHAMKLIPKPLYLARMYPEQSQKVHNAAIQTATWKLYNDNIEAILLRWCKDNNLWAISLGQGYPGYRTASLRWFWMLWRSGSVGVIKAYDILPKAKNKHWLMKQIHRLLAPGGMLLSLTPSTDGRGAWQDPTNRSFWNEHTFWYWTKFGWGKYIKNKRWFIPVRLVTDFPSEWHRTNQIPYVTADLVKHEDGLQRFPGLFTE